MVNLGNGGTKDFVKDFLSSVKLFVSLFLCKFYSMVKIWKNLVQKEIKDWTYKAYLLTEETSSWFLLIESLKITYAKSYAWFLNFYQMERLWIVFRGMSYPNWVK